jgi:hypothetical protein
MRIDIVILHTSIDNPHVYELVPICMGIAFPRDQKEIEANNFISWNKT